ncbi:MAG TPA: hypothetical protein ENH82_09675 [bacterium]|nr:hypothetical protein [bacterium]
MRKLKTGDKIDITDGSYVFGICNGQYSEHCNHQNGDREGLTVIAVDLHAMADCREPTSGEFSNVCDILATDNEGNYWFIRSDFVQLCNHTITIDGKKIEISGKSYEALKKQFYG